MAKPILDKAEVSIDFPDKFYHGSFSRSSQYSVKVDGDGVHIELDRREGEKRHVAFHLHYQLFSGILNAIAEELEAGSELSDLDLERLKEVTDKLVRALDQH